jgi:pimeloyl-ACP methyl ester carboxylesterase
MAKSLHKQQTDIAHIATGSVSRYVRGVPPVAERMGMWRWTKRILVGLLCFFVLAASAGAIYQWLATRRELAETPPPGQLVDVGGHRLHLWCTGTGAPTVILETGLGGSSSDWGFVQPPIAQFTRVCSYDRAGMGYSDPGPSPRTARRIAGELAALIDRSGLNGPLVLVAASSGGFNVRVFTSDHIERVAGLVLIDASHEDQAHEVPRLAPWVPLLSSFGIFRLLGISFGPSPAMLPPSVQRFVGATRFRAAGQQAAANEIIHIRDSASQVRATRRKLSIPVVVVTGARGADATWRDLQRDQVALSEHGCQITAEDSGHLVQIEQPAIVVKAIRSIVDGTRSGKVPACESKPASP